MHTRVGAGYEFVQNQHNSRGPLPVRLVYIGRTVPAPQAPLTVLTAILLCSTFPGLSASLYAISSPSLSAPPTRCYFVTDLSFLNSSLLPLLPATTPRSFPPASEGIMLVNMSLPTWPIMFVNEAWEKATGIPKDSLTGDAFWRAFTVCEGWGHIPGLLINDEHTQGEHINDIWAWRPV